jgi:tetratricopeptide (TPR) repeat protein
MGKLIFLFVGIFSCLSLSCFAQERQDEQRAQLEIKMLGQSEKLAKITGWSKIENSEGKFWKQSDVNSESSYLPSDPNNSFEYFQTFKFKLEGQIFYLLIIKFRQDRMRTFAFTSSSLERMKNIVQKEDGQSYYAIDIKYCDILTTDKGEPVDFDPETAIKNKEMIRLLLLGKGTYSTSNYCSNDSLFLINSQILKGESIVRFNFIDWGRSVRDNDNILLLTNNYFELNKNVFLKLFNFSPYLSEKACIKLAKEKHDSGDFAGAIIEYSKAIEINPGNDYYFGSRGNARYSAKDFTGAISDYSKALSMIDLHYGPNQGQNENDASVLLYLIANAKLEIEDFSGAITDCDKSIEYNSQRPDPYLLRAIAKISLGIKDDSICIDLGKAVQLGGDAKALFNEYCRINVIGTNKQGNSWVVLLNSDNDETALLQSQKDFQSKYNIETEIIRDPDQKLNWSSYARNYVVAGKDLTRDEALELARKLKTLGFIGGPRVVYELKGN